MLGVVSPLLRRFHETNINDNSNHNSRVADCRWYCYRLESLAGRYVFRLGRKDVGVIEYNNDAQYKRCAAGKHVHNDDYIFMTLVGEEQLGFNFRSSKVRVGVCKYCKALYMVG